MLCANVPRFAVNTFVGHDFHVSAAMLALAQLDIARLQRKLMGNSGLQRHLTEALICLCGYPKVHHLSTV